MRSSGPMADNICIDKLWLSPATFLTPRSRRFSKRLAHHDGGTARPVGAAIIAGALPDFDKPEALIQGQSRRVVLGHFEEHRLCRRVRRLTQILAEKRPTYPPALMFGVDGNSQNLRFVRRQTRQDEPPQAAAYWIEGRGADRRRTGDERCHLLRRPGMSETFGVQARTGLRPVRPKKTDDRRGRSAQAEDHGFGSSPRPAPWGWARPHLVAHRAVSRKRGARDSSRGRRRDPSERERQCPARRAQRRGRKAVRHAGLRWRRARRRRRRTKVVRRQSGGKTPRAGSNEAAPADGRTPRTTENRLSHVERRLWKL